MLALTEAWHLGLSSVRVAALLGMSLLAVATSADAQSSKATSLRLESDPVLRAASPYRLSVPRSEYRLARPEKPTADPNKFRINALIKQHAKARGLDPSLVEAVVNTESAYQADAVSPKGAIGLMQVMPDTGSRFGISKLNDAGQNLKAGTLFLRHLIDRYDNLPLALAAYNAGEGAVEKYGNTIPPYPETQAYVSTVLRHYQAQSLPDAALSRNYLDGTRLELQPRSPFRLTPATGKDKN